ncbi:N-acetylmuramoyl-L-alanine amidase [Candidatus Epulonipiscium fishelsonii]|uniref:N-acetylmuramoyl-L-alanine amidase n=1 Tax=Candidatus Epulonipiscium fishelsonii TaxID=77094 RepID=A0ACC8X9T9_9FIRM|nr:N-acetylmuramoyl-L-alanine amidase [Epulopiscium sp. SCG-B11WGA-EpuloA1]
MKTVSIILLGILLCIPVFGMDKKLNVPKQNFTVCIDPGHQAKGNNKTEAIAPGSTQKKAKVSSGTTGIGTKKPEYEVNLEASLILKQLLEKEGITVVMTREDHNVNISNAERAQISNNNKADMTIRIHCDSIDNSEKTGVTILVPSDTSKYTQSIYAESQKYAEYLKEALISKDIQVNGIFKREDITGFNWSQVPVIILEMGFMSNWHEDKMLSSPEYQTKLMESVVDALRIYKNSPAE